MLFFVRFVIAFILTLAIAAGIIYFFHINLAMMKSPADEKIVIKSIYKLQNNGAEQRNASAAMSNVASYCFFVDARGTAMPVTPLQQKLTKLYSGIKHLKATSDVQSINIDGNNAVVVAETKVDWTTKSGAKHELITTTKDKWEKQIGQWTVNDVKIETTNDSHAGFVVPH